MIKIEDLSDRAEGIGHTEDGKTIFVKGALPGETVNVRITEDKGRFFKGEAEGFNEKSCGGAPLIRMPYDDQLRWKEKRVRDCLVRIAKISEPKVNSIIGAKRTENYRNKGEFSALDGLPKCNVGCRECSIQSERAMEVLERFREGPRKNTDRLIVRTAKDGSFMAYTIQKNGYELLYSGEKVLKDSIGNIQIEVDPFSFYQVNTEQCENLYSLVKSYVQEGDSMLDLYCGAGTIGLFCSDKCSRVIGVEVVHEAILQANRNAIINHIVNTTFVEGKAEDVVDTKLQGVKADIVVVDPPRAGCKESLLRTITKIGPSRIVYVSCDPATLARDIALLTSMKSEDGAEYEFVEATPVDMFPHTVHVETVVLLVRKTPDAYVRIKMDMEDFDLTKPEAKE